MRRRERRTGDDNPRIQIQIRPIAQKQRHRPLGRRDPAERRGHAHGEVEAAGRDVERVRLVLTACQGDEGGREEGEG